jgi:hypothetical protein
MMMRNRLAKRRYVKRVRTAWMEPGEMRPARRYRMCVRIYRLDLNEMGWEGIEMI